MDAYHKTGARRAVEEEVRAWIERRTSCTPVYGLSEIVEVGDAVVGGPRVAGFMETHDLREWILPLSARKPLSWKTQPVPGNVAGRVCFAMSVGFGNGSPLPQPSGWWDVHVNGRFAVSIRVVNHDQLWRAGPCEFAFTANRIETAPPYAAMRLSSVIAEEAFAAFGPALLAVPSEWLAAGRPAEIRV